MSATPSLNDCDIFADLVGEGVIPASLNSLMPLTYAGAAPGTVTGVVQINFQVNGNTPYYGLTANGRTSNLFFVYVTP